MGVGNGFRATMRDDKDDGEMKMGGKALKHQKTKRKLLSFRRNRSKCGWHQKLNANFLSFRRNRSKWGLAMVSGLRSLRDDKDDGEMKMGGV